MRKINKPTFETEQVFLKCIEKIRNANLKSRLEACKDKIVEAAEEFEDKINKVEIHTILRENCINSNVSAKELSDVYNYRMVNKNGNGRIIYESIYMSASQGICPFCSQRQVSTLDHFLPKSYYPRLSVVPINLIPSCTDCNKFKLTGYPTKPEEEMIHPYFDDIEKEIWLKSTIITTTPPSIKFEVIKPDKWDTLLFDRVIYHFEKLSLNKLYSTHAAVELIQIKKQLDNLFIAKGSTSVKEYLLECSISRAHENLNSWQASFYKEIANSTWYCNGGFKLI